MQRPTGVSLRPSELEGLSPTGLARLAGAIVRPLVLLADESGGEAFLEARGAAVRGGLGSLCVEVEASPRSAASPERVRKIDADASDIRARWLRHHWFVDLYCAGLHSLVIGLAAPGYRTGAFGGLEICEDVLAAAADAIVEAEVGPTAVDAVRSVPGAVVTAAFNHPVVVDERARHRALIEALIRDPLCKLDHPSGLGRLLSITSDHRTGR